MSNMEFDYIDGINMRILKIDLIITQLKETYCRSHRKYNNSNRLKRFESAIKKKKI